MGQVAAQIQYLNQAISLGRILLLSLPVGKIAKKQSEGVRFFVNYGTQNTVQCC